MNKTNMEQPAFIDYHERFVRWQDYLNKQLGYLINLFLTIALGTLGFQIGLAFSQGFKFYGDDKVWYVLSSSLLFLSILFGVGASTSRLVDFRMTTRVIRGTMVGRPQHEIDADRNSALAHGRLTWSALSLQIAVFGLAFLFLVGFYVCQFLGKFF
jgi:hypothetical protein